MAVSGHRRRELVWVSGMEEYGEALQAAPAALAAGVLLVPVVAGEAGQFETPPGAAGDGAGPWRGSAWQAGAPGGAAGVAGATVASAAGARGGVGAAVAVPQGSPYAPVARYFSLAKGWPLLTFSRVEELRGAASGSLTIFAEPERLTPTFMRCLAEATGRVTDRGVAQEVAFGIITARDAAALTRLVARGLLLEGLPYRPGEDLLVLHPVVEPIDSERVLTRKAATLEAVMRLCPRGNSWLSFWAHGRADRVFLGSDAICGLRRGARPESAGPSGRRPPCGAGQPCTPGQVAAAHLLPAPNVFLNTCDGFELFPGTYDPDYHLGLNLLDGRVSTLVTTVRVRWGEWSQNVLFSALIRAGYPVGEAVRALNNTLYRSQRETAPGFLLFGDPSRVYAAEPSRAVFPAAAAKDGVDYGGGADLVEIQWPGAEDVLPVATGGQGLMWARCDDPRGPAEGRGPREDGDPGEVRAPGVSTVLVYSLPDLRRQAFSLRLVPFPQRRVAALQQALAAAENLQALRASPPETRGPLGQFKTTLAAVSRALVRARTGVEAAGEVLEQLDRAASLVESASRAILAFMLKGSREGAFRFTDRYAGDFLIQSEEMVPGGCPFCGNPAERRLLVHPVQPVERLVVACPGCGTPQDTEPATRLRLRLAGPETVRPGENRFELVLENASDEPLRAFLAACLEKAPGVEDMEAWATVRPELTEAGVAPGGCVALPLVVSLSPQAPPQRCFLKVYALENLSIQHLMKPMLNLGRQEPGHGPTG